MSFQNCDLAPSGEEIAGLRARLSEAEEALRAARSAEGRLRAIYDGTDEYIGLLSPEGILLEANRASLEFAGSQRADVIGRLFWETVWFEHTPGAREAVRDAVQRAAAGEYVRFESVIRTPVGLDMMFDISFAPIRDESGRVIFIVPEGRDITQREQVTGALRESEEFNRTVLESSPDCVKLLDGEGCLQFKNINGQSLLEMDDFAAMRGQPWWNLWPRENEAVVRDAVERAKRGETARFQARGPTVKGTLKWWDVAVAPVAMGSVGGPPARLISVSRDITARKEAEAALRASDERMRLATEATAVGIWEWNLFTGEIRWDAQLFRIYGIDPTPDGSVHYSDWSGTVLPEDLPNSEAILRETVRTGGSSRREFRIVRRNDGECRHIEAVETVRANSVGQAEWVVGTNLDITERKRIQADLEEAMVKAEMASKAKDDFLSVLSHELRTPLSPVLMAVSALLDDGVADGMLREDLEMILRNVQLEVRLIDDLLDVTRISHGKLALVEQDCDLHEIVRHALAVCGGALRNRSIEIALSLNAPRAGMIGDPGRLQQVFWNLLNNASKFAPESGLIEISSWCREPDRLCVSVRDNGAGIDPAHLPLVFNAFEQGGVGTTQRFGGLGLGLAICRGIIDMHGGRIWAESEGRGKGATFVVELPVANRGGV